MTGDVSQQFATAMWQLYRDAKEIGYTASYFARMLDELGPLPTAKKLINDRTVSEGFTRLWELQRLDLAVEAVALRPPFRPLFTRQELEACRQRLRDYGFDAEPGRAEPRPPMGGTVARPDPSDSA